MDRLKKVILIMGVVIVFSISSTMVVFAGDEYDPRGYNSTYNPVKSISQGK